jgi:hypothetical protein
VKKITLFLLTNLFIFTGIKSMDIEVLDKSYQLGETSEQNDTPNPKSKKSNRSNRTDELLRQNNILLHALIMQNKIHFEYHDDIKYETQISVNQTAKNTRLALDKLYTSTNEQLKDKTLFIPMTGQTQSNKKECEYII